VALVQITPPAAAPISLAEVKAQTRVEGSEEDALLMGYVRSATDAVEQLTGLKLLDQEWEWSLDAFAFAFPHRCSWIRLPLAPLLSIVSIVYQDTTGAVQTLPVDTYLIRGLGSVQPAQLILAPGKTWPSTWHGPGAVLIRARYGWVDHNGIPEGLRQAVMMLASYWFGQREAASIGPDSGPVSHVPFAVRELVDPYRIWAA
jgi:uncharacterized phiE125 gp8 family phage protein